MSGPSYFNFVILLMAYNSSNHKKTVETIVALYKSIKAKEYDRTDTYIVAHIFPKHNIFISYSTWRIYKRDDRNKKALSQKPQMQLF